MVLLLLTYASHCPLQSGVLLLLEVRSRAFKDQGKGSLVAEETLALAPCLLVSLPLVVTRPLYTDMHTSKQLM